MSSFCTRNMNIKVQEINLLLFLKVFNVCAMGYTAHVQMIIHVLSNAAQHSFVDGCQGFCKSSRQVIHISGKGRYIHQAFHIPPRKKLHGVRSGDLGSHCRSTRSVCPEHLIHLSVRVVFRYCLTLKAGTRFAMQTIRGMKSRWSQRPSDCVWVWRRLTDGLMDFCCFKFPLTRIVDPQCVSPFCAILRWKLSE